MTLTPVEKAALVKAALAVGGFFMAVWAVSKVLGWVDSTPPVPRPKHPEAIDTTGRVVE